MKTLTVHARIADFETAAAFIESWLRRCRLSKEIVSENSLVFETLFNDILLKGFPEETEIKIETGYSIGNPVIKIGFPARDMFPSERMSRRKTSSTKSSKPMRIN